MQVSLQLTQQDKNRLQIVKEKFGVASTSEALRLCLRFGEIKSKEVKA